VALAGRYWFEPRWLRAYKNVPTVTVSEESKASLAQYGLTRVEVIPEGVDVSLAVQRGPRETAPTVVFIGRLEAHKRPDDAIRAFQLLRESALPSARLWVIGTGPMEEKLRRNAPAGVEFLGWLSHEEKILRLARAHVVIVTSVREGWGLVVTEAAEVGTPVVGYRVDGVGDSVRASNGVLTAPNPKQLSFVLQELLGSWVLNGFPNVTPGGVIPWREVAERILDFAASVRTVPIDQRAVLPISLPRDIDPEPAGAGTGAS
jgi:glycosyltransferase involved in cell wall biosynthesis